MRVAHHAQPSTLSCRADSLLGMTRDPVPEQVLDAATVVLASHRITRLIVSDDIWKATRIRLRNWLRHKGPVTSFVELVDDPRQTGKRYTRSTLLPGKTADLLSCPLCVGVWVTGATAAAWHHGGVRTRSAIRLAALAGAQSILATRT